MWNWAATLSVAFNLSCSTFMCPSFREHSGPWNARPQNPAATTQDGNYTYVNYGFNRLISREKNNASLKGVESFLPGFVAPSKTIMIFDVYCAKLPARGYFCGSETYAYDNYMGLVDTRHGGACNVCFSDGHVEAKKTPCNLSRPYIVGNNPYITGFFAGGSGTITWNPLKR
jgi:prepilin-type processing-associated H-X9-DG protein